MKFQWCSCFVKVIVVVLCFYFCLHFILIFFGGGESDKLYSSCWNKHQFINFYITWFSKKGKKRKSMSDFNRCMQHFCFVWCFVFIYFFLACSCCPHYAIPNQKRPDRQVERHRRSNEAPPKGGSHGHV